MYKIARSISVLLAVVILCVPALADRIDDYVATQLSERHIPGLALVVVKDGRVVKMKGYGIASLEFSVPVTTKTAFEIGSVSKQMTAAAIMLLAEEGKLGLDDRVSKHLAGTPEGWKDVTIRHLLAHSSGVKSYTSLDGFELIKRQKVGDFLKKLAPHPLEFTPGERTIYSNSGYTILGYVIEAVSGKSYIDFMRERIFRPLGMNSTTDRDPEYIIPNRAEGYEWRGDRYAGRSWDLTDLMGAGTIVSTIEDMAKWDVALNGKAFLRPESRGEWWKQFVYTDGKPSAYGLGWRIGELRGHKIIGHTGQTAGFNSVNNRYVGSGLSIIVLSNTGESGLSAQIANRIAKFYVPTMSLSAVSAKPERVAGLGEKLIAVLKARNEGKLDGAPVTPQLLRSLSTDRAKAVYRRIAVLGVPANAVFVESDSTGTRPSYRYRVSAGKRLMLWRISLDDDGRIAELALEEEE